MRVLVVRVARCQHNKSASRGGERGPGQQEIFNGLLEEHSCHNLVVDLQGLDYIGSEVIGVVIGLARRVTDRGGKAALCRASANVREVMQTMGLLRLWPHFESRNEAMNEVSKT